MDNEERDRVAYDIAVPSEDPKQREEGEKSKEVVVKGKEVADGKDAGKEDEIVRAGWRGRGQRRGVERIRVADDG